MLRNIFPIVVVRPRPPLKHYKNPPPNQELCTLSQEIHQWTTPQELRAMLAKHSSLNIITARCNNGLSLMTMVAIINNCQLIKMLPPELLNEQHGLKGPLHMATFFANVEAVETLLDLGADPNLAWYDLCTTLDVALGESPNGRPECCPRRGPCANHKRIICDLVDKGATISENLVDYALQILGFQW
jgi:hypothetical protein